MNNSVKESSDCDIIPRASDNDQNEIWCQETVNKVVVYLAARRTSSSLLFTATKLTRWRFNTTHPDWTTVLEHSLYSTKVLVLIHLY